MNIHEQERQHVERIMRRAAEMGYDPGRVAQALEHRPAAPIEYQPVMAVEQRRAWFGARAARRFARRS